MACRNATGARDKLVSGWGIDGVTTFQRGFPLKITWAGTSTPLEKAGLGISNIRPDVVAGCSKGGNRSLTELFQRQLLLSPAAVGIWHRSPCGFVHCAHPESTTLISLYSSGRPITERFGVEFRTEFFNLFNHPQFGVPGTGFKVHRRGEK